MSDPLAQLFDANVLTLEAPIDPADVATLGPREAALVANAVAKRQHEFATARRLAREALGRFGITGFEVVHDEARAPVWPEGIGASLSHSSTRAFVAMGRRDEVGTPGIDAEDRPTLAEPLWRMVLRAEEREALERLPPAQRGRLGLVLFSAKEALYKAQYPWSRTYMGFSELRVDLVRVGGASGVGLLEGEVACVFQRAVGPFASGTVVAGRFVELAPGGTLVTGVQVRRAPV
jgi:4'-phosphopantetheinyl transferase EntD